MATEQSSSESTPQKRQRRLKQDPQFIFENSTIDETKIDTTPNSNKQIIIKTKSKPVHSSDENITNTDLYEPGDIVWSKLGSFPWWPALIYRCDAEGGIYTKTLNSNNKTKRQYFVYFYGKYLEYAWLSTRSLLKYAGLNNFIKDAEAAVQQASTKSEQVELANRYQLKVSMKKRIQWDEAIELADHALTMTKDERIKEFNDLLNDVQNTKKKSKNRVRRRKISIDKNYQEEITPNKRHARTSLSSSFSSELPNDINIVEKSSQPSTSFQIQNDIIQLNNNKKEDEQPVIKKKRGRKSKSELKTLSTNVNHSVKKNQPIKKITNESEIEYAYLPLTNDPQTASSLIQANIPPLSNYEQKQIVESLINHNQDKTLTFDEARIFAINKAIEIVYENHNYRMENISSEWFYDFILLKYPSVVFKYRSWFEHIKPDIIPDGIDIIKLKQWQIALMIQAQIKAEQK